MEYVQLTFDFFLNIAVYIEYIDIGNVYCLYSNYAIHSEYCTPDFKNDILPHE